MSDTPRPSLKLTFGKKKAPGESSQSQPPAPPPPTETPQRKITLKIARRPVPEPAPEEEKPKKKKPSKKRPADGPPALREPSAAVTTAQPAGPKRLKLNTSKKPGIQSLRIKNKGLVPNRPVGVGYDSEASDTEIDPAIEEQFILRMLPGEDCELLRRAIAERRFDRSEFSFKPLNREGRRAVLKIRDHQYAAALVDLPCIIEGMKSWDRRGWYKSADICQMLLVLGPVANEQEALEYPLPSDIQFPDDKTLQYPHGLVPPLRWVRKRRFRERVGTRTIEQVEKAVEDLIAQDEASLAPPRYELVDSASLNRAEGLVQSGEYDEYDEEDYDDEQDAEGEVDEDGGLFDDFEDTLAAEMEAALAAGDDGEAAATAATGGEAPADTGVYQAGTPMATKPSTPAAETSGDDSDGSDDVPEDEMDEEQLEQQRQMQQQREEIAELETLIRVETAKWEKMQNAILKGKLAKRIHDLKQDLSLKKVSIGEGDDADN
ncbi:hypothetical protein BO70DRAFT_359440 [Aspergillus heteromorphus CBS 117.55]|uniref:TAFII55 protein conserved region domain-containing protein n=1 Tax=Aspergillus heteromorphus CBS 117.55 TaxID=1448321 RepID=A0A317WWC3_9EURO|nr:uncharacterized protein BO70DRAFT_359440 [Aspergillus heteromorphus CBS 117.55]PWY89118.1 hypothetical protein BO70DRAFT_359440 [Aspergillus heteromorphus CBS 117.55]